MTQKRFTTMHQPQLLMHPRAVTDEPIWHPVTSPVHSTGHQCSTGLCCIWLQLHPMAMSPLACNLAARSPVLDAAHKQGSNLEHRCPMTVHGQSMWTMTQ
jgi:hypothetical protein